MVTAMNLLRPPALALLLTLAACASTPARASLQQLQARAAYDFACPPQWMRLHDLDASTKGVEGCGKRVTYVERCTELADGRCTWALDMAVQPITVQPITVQPITVQRPLAAQPLAPPPVVVQQPPEPSRVRSLDPLGDRR